MDDNSSHSNLIANLLIKEGLFFCEFNIITGLLIFKCLATALHRYEMIDIFFVLPYPGILKLLLYC